MRPLQESSDPGTGPREAQRHPVACVCQCCLLSACVRLPSVKLSTSELFPRLYSRVGKRGTGGSGADGKVLGTGSCGTIVQTKSIHATRPPSRQLFSQGGWKAWATEGMGNGEWEMEKHLIAILTGGAWQGIGVPAAGLIKYWRRGGLRNKTAVPQRLSKFLTNRIPKTPTWETDIGDLEKVEKATCEGRRAKGLGVRRRAWRLMHRTLHEHGRGQKSAHVYRMGSEGRLFFSFSLLGPQS